MKYFKIFLRFVVNSVTCTPHSVCAHALHISSYRRSYDDYLPCLQQSGTKNHIRFT